MLFRPMEGILPRYFQLSISNRSFLAGILAMSKGIGAKHVNVRDMKHAVIAIPPLPEQYRIVAKIDQLMARCDELEKLRTERDQKRLTVHTAALNRLLTAQTSDSFTDAWRFIAQHFGELYSVKENVAELRKAILQLAVMGKLVPQDPNDEPASDLLKEIETEKRKLIQEGKIKKPKTLPKIEQQEIPYQIPFGWEWSRLGDLGYILGGGTPSKSNSEYWNGEIPWVSPKDMRVDYIQNSQDHISRLALTKTTVKLIPTGSLLLVVRGMILAHSFPAAVTASSVTVNQDMKALCPYESTIKDYLLLLTKGKKGYFLNLVERSSHGTCRLETNKLFSSLVAIPPLPEQYRIVAKVDQLMALCDTLEQHIDHATHKQTALLNVVMAQV